MCPNSMPLSTRCPPNSVLLHARSAQLAGYRTHASHAATASPHAAVIPPPNPIATRPPCCLPSGAYPFAASLRIKLMAVYLAEDINATTLQVNPNPNPNPNPNANPNPNQKGAKVDDIGERQRRRVDSFHGAPRSGERVDVLAQVTEDHRAHRSVGPNPLGFVGGSERKLS